MRLHPLTLLVATFFHIAFYLLLLYFIRTDCAITKHSLSRFMEITYASLFLGAIFIWRGIRVIHERAYIMHSPVISLQTIYRSLFAPFDKYPTWQGRDAALRGILLVLFGFLLLSNFYWYADWYKGLACEELPTYLNDVQNHLN